MLQVTGIPEAPVLTNGPCVPLFYKAIYFIYFEIKVLLLTQHLDQEVLVQLPPEQDRATVSPNNGAHHEVKGWC